MLGSRSSVAHCSVLDINFATHKFTIYHVSKQERLSEGERERERLTRCREI